LKSVECAAQGDWASSDEKNVVCKLAPGYFEPNSAEIWWQGELPFVDTFKPHAYVI
jgi:hypothetical protein